MITWKRRGKWIPAGRGIQKETLPNGWYRNWVTHKSFHTFTGEIREIRGSTWILYNAKGYEQSSHNEGW